MELRCVGNSLVFKLVVLLLVVVELAAKCPNLRLPNGRVRLRSRGRSVQFRCHRGFTRVGAKMAICLKSGKWSQPMPHCVGQGCKALDLPETVISTRLHRGGIAKFACTSGHMRVGPEQIYCDGKNWNTDPPSCQRGMTSGCDFETEGLCGWSQVVNTDQLDWTRRSGSTPTKGTGPVNDHTKKSPDGHYLFLESSAPAKRGHGAHLISPTFDPNDVNDMCMNWAYHMYGSPKRGDMGKLEVFIRPTTVPLRQLNIDSRVISLFDLTGNQGDEWHTQEVEIPDDLTTPFQIVFEARRQNSWLNDIAIDDIRIYKCAQTTISLTTEANTTTELPTTVRRTTTTTELPTTTTRRTTTEMPTTTRTTTEMPTTTTRTTTEMPTTTTRTTTEMPTTTTRRRTTTEMPTTTRRRTTTDMPTTRTRRRTTTEMPTTRSRTRTSTTFEMSSTSRRSERMTPDLTTAKSMELPSLKSSPNTPSSPISSTKGIVGRQESTPVQDFVFVKTTSDFPSVSTGDSNIHNDSTGRSTTSKNTEVGQVKDNADPATSGTQKLLPLILGVVGAVILVAIVIAVLAYKYAKKQRVKEEKEVEDQLNIISEYVETSLSQ